ncbi:MAG: hypothetical protein JHC93_06740 [Parachlamydiales bacterium]|nr:hypothetical protein [Parachlamydiales bacterium]
MPQISNNTHRFQTIHEIFKPYVASCFELPDHIQVCYQKFLREFVCYFSNAFHRVHRYKWKSDGVTSTPVCSYCLAEIFPKNQTIITPIGCNLYGDFDLRIAHCSKSSCHEIAFGYGSLVQSQFGPFRPAIMNNYDNKLKASLNDLDQNLWSFKMMSIKYLGNNEGIGVIIDLVKILNGTRYCCNIELFDFIVCNPNLNYQAVIEELPTTPGGCFIQGSIFTQVSRFNEYYQQFYKQLCI